MPIAIKCSLKISTFWLPKFAHINFCSDGCPFFILQVDVCGQLEVFAFVCYAAVCCFVAVYLLCQLLQILHILNLIRVFRCAFPCKIRSFIFEYHCAVFFFHQQRNSFRRFFLAFLLRLDFLVRLLLQFFFFFFQFLFFLFQFLLLFLFRFLFQFLFDFLLDFLKHFLLHELLLRHGTHRHRRYRKAYCRRNAYPFLPIHITPPSCAFADYGKAPISSAKILLVIIITWYHICFFSARKNKINFSFWKK